MNEVDSNHSEGCGSTASISRSSARSQTHPSYTSAPPRYGGWVCLRDTNKAIGFFLVLHSLRHICLRVFYALPSACKVIFILKKFQDSFSSFFQLLLCVSQAIPVLSQFLHSSPVLGSRMCKYFLLMKVMAVTVHSFVV